MAKKIIYDKVPPQAPDIEDAILSIILHDDKLIHEALKLLKPECFYQPYAQDIFSIMLSMNERNIPIELITITTNLQGENKSNLKYYLATIYTKYSSSLNFSFYCKTIFDLFVRREMILMFQNEANNLYNLDTDIFQVYTKVIERLEGLFEQLSEEQIKHIKNTVTNTINEIKTYSETPELAYIRTGINLIDKHIYLSHSFILAIAAPRGAGKTRYLINMMKNIFQINKDKVAALWYSMEDSDSKIVRLFASAETGIADNHMQSKSEKLSHSDMKKVIHAIEQFSDYNITFVNQQESMAKISRTFTQFTRKNEDKTCFLIIDNIMLVEDLYTIKEGFRLDAEDKVAASIRRIINNGKNRGIKVIVIFLHHMTKEMESSRNKEEAYRPKLAHMKGSTRFADIANAVILLHKPGLYKDLIKHHAQLPDIKCYNSDGSTKMVKRTTLLQNLLISEVAKNRDGETADDELAVQRDIVDFGIMKFQELKT